MEIRHFYRIIILSICILFFACSENKPPTNNDILGKWVSDDHATLFFKSDGRFEGDMLREKLLANYILDSIEKRFNGGGTWNLQKNQGRWQVNLIFDNIKDEKGITHKVSYSYSILLSESGNFETENDWYLFTWIGEEGGDRYIFKLKNSG